MEAVTETKQCNACLAVLPLTQFHKNKSKKFGVCEVCKPCKYKQNKRYYSSPAGRLAVSGQTKRKWVRVKQKVAARNAVNMAIQRGALSRKPCEICNNPISEAHHEDYSKPFEIRWLCEKHHLEVHGKKLNKE